MCLTWLGGVVPNDLIWWGPAKFKCIIPLFFYPPSIRSPWLPLSEAITMAMLKNQRAQAFLLFYRLSNPWKERNHVCHKWAYYIIRSLWSCNLKMLCLIKSDVFKIFIPSYQQFDLHKAAEDNATFPRKCEAPLERVGASRYGSNQP